MGSMGIFDEIIEKAGGRVHAGAVLYLAVINLTAFLMYGYDKYQAKHGGWRVPEKTLLLLAAIGGSAGAWIGMQVFRHKTRKAKFSLGVPVIFAIQCVIGYYAVFV